jgi:hypothetical protein
MRQVWHRRLSAPRRIGMPYRVIACHDPQFCLVMMRFQLIDSQLSMAMQALAGPISFPRRQPECRWRCLFWSGGSRTQPWPQPAAPAER